MNHDFYYETFLKFLNIEDKENAVSYAISLLEEQKLSIEELYIELLAPSLHTFECNDADQEICIWKEHFRTSIIRTILEISYGYILRRLPDIQKTKSKIVVLTPAFEFHEIGAIMNTHFLLLEGFNASYIGANTPKSDILSAIRAYQPDFIALSVTNPYNLVITKQITDEIKRFFPEVKIILGGQAFHESSNLKELKYDYIMQNLKDIKAFRNEVTS
jgi:MerR family transcriptional regulator, light-induced transcriptional regulator